MPTLQQHYSLLPPVIRLLLISNVLIFFLQPAFADTLIGNFALWPLYDTMLAANLPIHGEFAPWQLLSYAFLHGNLMHLILNMYALWLFGVALENLWGSRNFAIYYLVCVLGAALTQLLVTAYSGEIYPTIGASGGVFGVLLAFGLFFPNQVLLLLIPPVPIRAKYFVLLYGAVELVFGVTGTDAGVAHFAHLGGMLFGFLLILSALQHPPRRR